MLSTQLGLPRPAALYRTALCFVACFVALVPVRSTWAEDERLCDLPPFDQVVLDQANGNKVLAVETLNFPNRKVPAIREGELKIRLLADPTRPFVVSWDSVRDVLLFEDNLLREAQRLTAAGKFDEAFDYYDRLLVEYPALPGLGDSVNDYLRRNAVQLAQAGEYDRSLAVLSALFEREPNAPGLVGIVDAVCGKMIEAQLRDKKYADARGVLDMWRKEFRTLNSQAAVTWEQRFATAAQRQVQEARQLIAAKDYVAARKAMGRARDIWPESNEADALLAEIQQANPSVAVGVFEASPKSPAFRIDDWATLRTDRLLDPLLSELAGFGSEGGVYKSRYGEWVADDNGLRLSLKMSDTAGANSETPTADEIARFLLNLADPSRPEFRPDFAAVLAGVSVEGAEWVHLDWRRPHVRPESLLQLPLARTALRYDSRARQYPVGTPDWVVADSAARSVIYNAVDTNTGPQPWLRTIVEQTMPDDQAAIDALVTGEIDVLDRVPPWQLQRLRAAKDIRVASYALPTVHVLVVNPANPLLREREFRRALCFGIQRDRILKQILLGGADLPGFTVLSGPFPAGLSFSDPLRYAYNNQLEPRPFEPRLAAVLAAVAWGKILDPTGKGEVEPQPIPTLTLAHPADPLARVACETIQVQLTKAGIPIKLVEFTADELLAGKVEYDLRYAELAVWEPIADAPALLGPNGLAGKLSSPYLAATLRDLETATNWKDVRSKMSEIHDIAHHDLPLIPLWQTVNYFAYRARVQGIGESPVTLYQNIDHWRLGGDSSVAGLKPLP
jgi:tetratricopeptide (TPR) repeat protein